MKKVLYAVCAVILACVMLVVSASAAGGSASLSADASSVKQGDSFSVSVSVSEATGVETVGVIPLYDKSEIEFIGATWLIGDSNDMSGVDMSVGAAVFAFKTKGNISGPVLNLTFKVKNNAELKAVTIGATVKVDGETLSTSSASVTVVCAHSYVEVVDAKYLKSEATCAEKAVYYKSCSKCNAASSTEFFSAGEFGEHKYDQEKVTADYLKSPATCVSKATYYKSCKCGEKGSDTFEVGELKAHTYTDKIDPAYKAAGATCTEAEKYYKSCSCGNVSTETFTVGTALGHTGGTATCTEKAICTRCGQPHGDILPHKYDKQIEDEKYKKNDASCTVKKTYYKSCVCGAAGTETFEVGELKAHTYTEKIDPAYKAAGATCTEAEKYYKSCSCGNVSTEIFTVGTALGHTGGTATCTEKAICTRCGQPHGDILPHKYDKQIEDEKYKKNDASCTVKKTYYKSCVCGAAGTETFEVGEKLDHSYVYEIAEQRFLKEAATCTTKAVYYKSCVCGTVGNETFEYGSVLSHNYATTWTTDATSHWHQCSVCGDKADVASHIAGDAATETTAQICEVCAYIITPTVGHTHNYSTEWSNNSDSHWYACDGCSERKDEAAHAYDNNCDTDCNVCGYIRAINHSYKKKISSDAEKHWYECEVCGNKIDEAAHTPGADATEESAQTCTVCGYVIKAALEHTHSFGDEWKKDEVNHWQECKCGETSGLAAHAWNGGIVTTEPTAEAEGVKTYTCETCGVEKTDAVEKLPDNNDGENDPIESEPTGNAKKGCSNSISVGVGFMVIALSTALTFVFKKKED